MTSRIGKGLRKHVPNGQDEARTARSGLRSTEKSTAMQRTYSSQVGLDDSLKALAATVTQVEGASESGLAQQLDTVTQQVDQVNAENDELRVFFQEALQEAERLKKENEELRKLGEDAVLDQQLSKALQETDKLKLAADAYKKELLQQKVTELQSELAQTSKRLKAAEEENIGLTQAMKGAKGATHTLSMGPRTDSLRSLDRASVADVEPSVRQAVLSRLQAPHEERGDVEKLLAAAAKALKDAGAAEAQLADAVALNAKLQGEVDQLNDTVFSKTFRAPSAWAEREVKYKMDKKAWDSQAERLQSVINKLKAENVEYRNNSKTDQFEARIQELEKKLQDTEGAKVTAQRALHELQLDMQAQVQKYTQLQQARRHQDASSDEGIGSRIEEFDKGQMGVAQPAKAAPKALATGRQARGLSADAAVSAEEASQSQDAAAAGTHVQGVIVNMNAHHIGPQHPSAAPHDETDTLLHDQPVPDVISSAPNTDFTPSSSHTVHSSHPSGPAGNAAGSQAVATSSTQPQTHFPSSAEATQESSSSAVTDAASSAQSYTHQRPASQPVAAPSSTRLAAQPALHTNVDDEQPQEGARQRQQDADNAVQSSAHTSPSSQQHPEQTGDPTQPSEVHASYEDKGFVPSTAHHQSQSATPAGPTHSQSDAEHSPRDVLPSIKHFGSGALSRLDALGGDEPTSSANAASQAAEPQPEAQQSSQTETASHAGDPATSQYPAHTADIPADETDSPEIAAIDQTSKAAPEGIDEASTSCQGDADQACEPAMQAAAQLSAGEQEGISGRGTTAQPGAAAEQESVGGRDSTAQPLAAGERESISGRDSSAHPAGPAAEEDDSADDQDDDLLTLTDAVHHVARSTRQSRANSGDALDEPDPPAGPSDYPAPPTPMAPPAQPQAAPRVTFEDAGHLAIPGSAVSGMARGSVDLNGVSSLSEASEQWTEDRVRQLEEDKAVIERLWGEHAQENDIGVLKFKLAEFESRCEMYEAQVTKMQRSMERSDQDKARVEEQLATAIALNHSGDKQGLTAMRERLQNVVSGRSSKTNQLEDRLKEAEQQLQQSYRERDGLEKQRAKLEHELASWSKKLGVDIPMPASESVDASDASASSKGRSLSRWRSSASGFGVDGLSEGEVEVMHLREENEALMESLVRTKVDLAETEGEYLKTKRSLIRANEKLASLSERIDSLKAALSKAGVPLPSMTDSPSARSDTSTNPFGTPRSVMGTPKSAAAQALEAHL